MNFSQYDLATGLFTGRISFSTRPGFVPRETPGMGWVSGRYDHTQWRVDLQTGEVVPKEQP